MVNFGTYYSGERQKKIFFGFPAKTPLKTGIRPLWSGDKSPYSKKSPATYTESLPMCCLNRAVIQELANKIAAYARIWELTVYPPIRGGGLLNSDF